MSYHTCTSLGIRICCAMSVCQTHLLALIVEIILDIRARLDASWQPSYVHHCLAPTCPRLPKSVPFLFLVAVIAHRGVQIRGSTRNLHSLGLCDCKCVASLHLSDLLFPALCYFINHWPIDPPMCCAVLYPAPATYSIRSSIPSLPASLHPLGRIFATRRLAFRICTNLSDTWRLASCNAGLLLTLLSALITRTMK